MSLLRLVSIVGVVVLVSCGEKSVLIDDAEKPRTITIKTPAGVKSVELKVHGLLSGEARLHLLSPGNEQPLKTLYLIPTVVAGMPRGLAPAATEIEYTDAELLVKYEPDRKVEGHLEITYRFTTR